MYTRPPNNQRWMTAHEAAQICGLSAYNIIEFISEGLMDGQQISGTLWKTPTKEVWRIKAMLDKGEKPQTKTYRDYQSSCRALQRRKGGVNYARA